MQTQPHLPANHKGENRVRRETNQTSGGRADGEQVPSHRHVHRLGYLRWWHTQQTMQSEELRVRWEPIQIEPVGWKRRVGSNLPVSAVTYAPPRSGSSGNYRHWRSHWVAAGDSS